MRRSACLVSELENEPRSEHSSFASTIITMASRKRSRANDDDEVEVESASSGFRQTQVSHVGHQPSTSILTTVQKKRSRLQLARENGGSVVSDEEDEIEGVPQSYVEDDSSSDDGSFDDLQATQAIEKELREFKENAASDQGVIEEVGCRNFMCHGNLKIKLGPLINFIIGHNGSGKSAVLTALTMCLGGKATATNRGTSLKSMIKEGQDNASLSVKIKNQGDGAYKPELYGRSITVERHFNRAGTSGFKIKNADDRIVSTKKADLEDILDFFAFQLDNPINVLTQDMARQFLSNSTPADKYKFFIRGTQLEQLDRDYKLLEEYLDGTEAKLGSRQADVDALKAKALEAEKRKRRLDATATIQTKITETSHMHAWAQVEEQERLLQRHEEGVERVEEKIQQATVDAEGFTGTYDGHNQAFEAAQRTAEDLKEQGGPLKENHTEVKEQFDQNTKELKEIEAQRRAMRVDAKSLTKRKEDRINDIDQERRRLASAGGDEHAAKLEELEEAKAEAQQAKERYDRQDEGLPALAKRLKDSEVVLQNAKPGRDQQREALTQAESVLNGMRREQPTKFAGFKKNMANLVRAIDNERRFQQKPAGPMGLHVRLLKPEWSSILEKTFGPYLDGFAVTCNADQRLLSDLMKRTDCNCGVYIVSPNRIDTAQNEPEEGVDTTLRITEIDNDLVHNALVVNVSIDQTVLIRNRAECEEFMIGARRPANVRAAMCFASRGSAGIRYESTRTGAQKSSPVDEWKGPPRMKTDMEAQIRLQQEKVHQLRREIDETQSQMRTLELAVDQARKEMNRHHKTKQSLLVDNQRADDRVESLKNDIEANMPQDGKLQELERQLKEIEESEALAFNQYDDADREKIRLHEIARDLKDRLNAAQKELEGHENRVQKAEIRMNNLAHERHHALMEKNKALNAIDVAKREKEAAEQARDAQANTVAEFTGAAEGICRRVPVDDGVTATHLDKRLEKFQQDLKRAQQE